MLVFMATWPAWAIYAAVGGICGGLGAAMGSLVAKRWPKLRIVFVVLGFVVSRPLTQEVVLPQVRIDAANQGLPKKIDEITTLERVELEPTTVKYDFKIDDKIPLASGETMKAGIAPAACGYWKQQFKAGSILRATYVYSFKDGQSSFDLVPSDCP